MFSITMHQIGMIRHRSREGFDIADIAKKFAIPRAIVEKVILNQIGPILPNTKPETPEETQYGREELRRYMISSRSSSMCYWPVEDSEKINKAQKEYDEGIIDMCQGRSTRNYFLYAIPRREKDLKRTPYFSRIFGD